MEEKVLTRHPQGKQGVNISRAKYAVVRSAVLGCLRGGRELTHPELNRCVIAELDGKFDGSVSWYMECLKLDLEARRVIERTETNPQRYRLVG